MSAPLQSEGEFTPLNCPVAQGFTNISYIDSRIDPAFFSAYPDAKKRKVLIPPTVIPNTTIAQLWAKCFAFGTPFLEEYHEKRRDAKNVVPQWDFSGPGHSCGSRWFTCTTLVEVPSKDTPTTFVEAQRYCFTKEATPGAPLHFVLQLSAQTPDVPAGSTFRVEALLEFVEETRIGPDGAEGERVVTISINGGTKKWTAAFTLIKPIAEPRAVKDMIKAYQLFVAMIMGRDVAKAEEGDAAAVAAVTPTTKSTGISPVGAAMPSASGETSAFAAHAAVGAAGSNAGGGLFGVDPVIAVAAVLALVLGFLLLSPPTSSGPNAPFGPSVLTSHPYGSRFPQQNGQPNPAFHSWQNAGGGGVATPNDGSESLLRALGLRRRGGEADGAVSDGASTPNHSQQQQPSAGATASGLSASASPSSSSSSSGSQQGAWAGMSSEFLMTQLRDLHAAHTHTAILVAALENRCAWLERLTLGMLIAVTVTASVRWMRAG